MDYTTVGNVIRDLYLGPMSEIAGFRLHLLDEEFVDGVYNYWIAGHRKRSLLITWGKISIASELVARMQGEPEVFARHLQRECKYLAREFRDAIPR